MVKQMDVHWNWLLLIFLFCFAGCVGIIKPVEEPRVTLVDLQVVEVKALETVFQIQLRVINPNDYPFDLQGVNCDLKIDGKYFASGVGNQTREISAFGTAQVPVMVYASTLNMFSSVLQFVQGMEQQAGLTPLRYELTGKIRVGGSLNRSVPFHSKGVLSLPGQN